ncbi:MAG: nucleotidyltransferase domain-containing protein, partial [Lachnospiraceae bacterium]|nr:nucleotidyltransferase domain-containing protein [Lachnospiraceae bacterium]
VRPLLACRWILKHGTPPPMLFDDLAAECLDPELKPAVDKLLQMKRETPELGERSRIGVINDYIDRSLEEIGAVIAELPEESSGSWEMLNSLFLAIVNVEVLRSSSAEI